MKQLLSLLFSLILTGNAFCQQIEMKELTTPATPAFTILGLSPSFINRPTSSKPFFVSVANGLNGSAIASDIAIETTPFWWKSHSNLTYEKYYGLDKDFSSTNKIANEIARSFAISFATSDASPEIDSLKSRYIASGIRFQFLNGKPSKKFKEFYLTINVESLTRAIFESIKRELEDTSTDLEITNWVELYEFATLSISEYIDQYNRLSEHDKIILKEKVKENIENYLNTIEEDLEVFDKLSVKNNFSKEIKQIDEKVNEKIVEMRQISRVGLLLEYSGAIVLLSPTNNLWHTVEQDWANWTTLTYRHESKNEQNNMHDFSLLTRIGGNFTQSNTINTDIGISWASFADDHSLSFEGIHRRFTSYFDVTSTEGQVFRVSESKNTWRFAFAYQYRLTDLINVSLSAGKDFENSKISAGGLFTLLNFNLLLPSKEILSVEGN
ncbi:hypothetical protein ACFSKL_19580 [Belliella marina]|uniref:DUF5723 domain-containing protein n=1 Tax=Belliella marina TaxID=1644146 RepID=A0ABW4VTX7_9BACT